MADHFIVSKNVIDDHDAHSSAAVQLQPILADSLEAAGKVPVGEVETEVTPLAGGMARVTLRIEVE